MRFCTWRLLSSYMNERVGGTCKSVFNQVSVKLRESARTAVPATPRMKRQRRPVSIPSVTTPSCGASLGPVTKPPASCAMTIPAYGASVNFKDIIAVKDSNARRYPMTLRVVPNRIILSANKARTKYERRHTRARPPYSPQ